VSPDDPGPVPVAGQLRAFLRTHRLLLFVLLPPIVSLASILWAPYGNATLTDCSSGFLTPGCTSLPAGSTLLGYVKESSSGPWDVFVLLAAELVLTLFGLVAPWVVTRPRSEGTGFLPATVAFGLLFTLGPWAGLQPTWGYGIITGAFWISLGASVAYRREARLQRERIQAAAEEQTRRDAEERFRHETPPSPGPSPESSSDLGKPPQKVYDAAVLLGVDVADPPEVVEAAYRRWVKTLHPDRNPSPRDATDQLQRVNNAREILQEYSRTRRRPGSGETPRWGS